jgi:hypothetical protein
VDLVDEQDVALLELGEDGGEVAGPLQRRARRDVQRDTHLGRRDAGQGRLAEPRRAGEEQVVDGLAAPAGRLDDDRQVLLQLALADEVGEQPRPQPDLDEVLGLAGDARFEELVTHVAPRAT